MIKFKAMNKKKERKPAQRRGFRASAVLLNVYFFMKRMVSLLPFWKHPDYVPFLVLCHQRSGSSWVNAALNSHPRILYVGEKLRGFFAEERGEEKLMKFFKTPQSKLVLALGLKMLYEDAYSPVGMSFWKHWRENNRPVVHLMRRNLMRTVVLDEIARQSQEQKGAGLQRNGAEVKAVEIYPEILLQRMAHVENLQGVFRSQLKEHPAALNVYYEDLLENPEEEFNKLQAFLGVSPVPIFSLLDRDKPVPLQELLLNYDEVSVMLRGGKWEAFLDPQYI